MYPTLEMAEAQRDRMTRKRLSKVGITGCAGSKARPLLPLVLLPPSQGHSPPRVLPAVHDGTQSLIEPTHLLNK